MKIIKYDKLVRDKIPEIIQRDGMDPITHIAGKEEYEQKLREKLGEEVKEFLSADEEEKSEEIADILEVLYAICDARGISNEEIEKLRVLKAKKRGGFQKRIILEETRGK